MSGTVQLDAFKKLGFSLALDVREVLDDLDARSRAVEQREGKACSQCAARRHTVQTLRARISATPTDGRIHEALLRHAELLMQEADRIEARYPRTGAGARP